MGSCVVRMASLLILGGRLVLAGAWIGALGFNAAAQTARNMGSDGVEAVKTASTMLLDLKASSLPHWWRALAVARLARTQARFGNEESARVLARDAVLLIHEPGPPPPPGLGAETIFALLSQAYLDMKDPQSSARLVNESLKAMQTVTDRATRANTFGFLGVVVGDMGGDEAARPFLLQALRDTAALPAGREQIAALAMIAKAQGRLNESSVAADTLLALNASLAHLSALGDIAFAHAHTARAAMAAQNPNAARLHVRAAIATYDRSIQEAEIPIAERIAILGLITLAQTEIGDKLAARQTLHTLKQTLAAVSEPYDKFQGLLTLADASFELEQPKR